MLRLTMATTLALTFSLAATAYAGEECEYSKKKATLAQADNISVKELASTLGTKAAPAVFDANSDYTREQFGVIPGAKLLTHYANFSLTELPASKSDAVVFYCGSEACSAAPKAASKAVQAGYKNVKVLKAGIKGWAKAGQKTAKPAATAKKTKAS